ncbi:MAG: hypothetical protein CMA05_04270 [Euryarchaeota archaeon]|nr:hypothetical protein [Euryarchaeota archaeon]
MVTRKSNRGQSIDMDALIAANKESPAVGNMKVNAAGDEMGPGGEIVRPNEDRVRAYYKENPSSSTSQVSLKGEMPTVKAEPDKDVPMEPKTAKTAKENKRKAQAPKEPSVVDTVEEVLEDKLEAIEEPDEFAEPEEVEEIPQPLGWKEVELPNGDIEMVPYYEEDDEDANT